MGIDISAKLIYGLNYSDLPEEILEEVDEMLDNGELEYASPYYDAPRDRWIVGVEIPAWADLNSDLGHRISYVEDEVPDILDREDIEMLVYVTPHVS